MRLQTYNSGITPKSKKSPVLICLFSLLCLAGVGWTQSFSGPEAELAEKILAATGPGALSAAVTNRSSLRSQTADEIRRGLLTELASRGALFVSRDQAAAVVEVFLSENEQSYLWIARVQQGTNTPAVLMVSLPRPAVPFAEPEAAQLRIKKNLWWSQPQRILDAGVIEGNPAHLAVLSAETIALYRMQGERALLEQTLPIAHQHPWPRDMRGRLLLGKDHLLEAYLPGVTCQSGSSQPLSLICRESDDPWPVGTEQFRLNAFFAPTRNFFTGAVSPPIGKQNLAPFYSAAAIPREKYTLWLTAAADGRVHLVDGNTDQVADKLGWGSDLAALHSACGSGWQVLATSSSEDDDSVRAFEIVDRTPVPASEALPFSGSITALWAEFSGAGAFAVVHNFKSDSYEAYRLTVTCDSR